MTDATRMRALAPAPARTLPAAGRIDVVPATLTVAAAAAWALSLVVVEPAEMGSFGLLSVLPATFFFALATLTVGFVLAVRHGRTALACTQVLLLIGLLHATPAIAYGTLRYAWAWKHVGVVDYIQRHGSVDETARFLDAYHNWPGFFGLSALFADLTGAEALALAPWAPVAFNVLLFGALLFVYRSLTGNATLVWLSIWLFFVVNWVGQDYFAPQTEALLLYLLVVGICLRWLRPDPSAPGRWLARRGPLADRRLDADAPVEQVTGRQRAGAAAAVVLLLAVIAATHQLTPLMVCLALIVLVLLGRSSVPTLAGLAVAVSGAWIAFPASTFVDDSLADVLDGFGRIGDNTQQTLIDLASASSDQVAIAWVGRVLTVAVVLVGLVGIVRRLRSHADVSAAALALAPFGLLALSSYGGEIAFRTYLFALPFLAFFAAALLAPAGGATFSPRRVAATSGVLLLALGSFLFPYYGKERQNYFSRDEVDVARAFYEQAPDRALLVAANTAYPWAFTRYERYSYAWLDRLTPGELERFLADPVPALDAFGADFAASSVYVILTESQLAETMLSGSIDTAALRRLTRQLAGSSRISVVASSKRATLLALHPERSES